MRLTKRQRLLAITGSAAALFVAGTAAVAWRVRRTESYRPGGKVEGLTQDLARNLPADYPRVTFTDASHAAGIDFQHFSGTRTSQIPEDMGSGAAWGDYDDDGWEDLVVANESGPLDMSPADQARSPARVTLYHNNHDGTFTDVTAKSGIDFHGLAMAVAWGDYDNDGRIDLLITAYGHCALYHNNGDGTFTDVSLKSGIGAPEGFWTGAAWGDYDRDGYLDLYVTGYVQYTRDLGDAKGKYDVENPASINPLSFKPARNLLFHNNRDGTFTEVAKKLGVDDPDGRGLSAAWVDLDEDGWPDLYVGNDDSNNRLFHNLGNGKFEDVSERARVLEYRSSMGIAVGDWNGDGYQDLFLTHWIAQGNALYDNLLGMAPKDGRKKPPLAFQDEADRFGLGQSSLDFVGWATSFEDYDNDGKPDLFIVNGSTLQDRNDPKHLVPMRPKLFWNHGADDGFYDVSPVSGDYFNHAYVGRGAAFADYDNDGDVDVFVVNNGGRGMLLRNDGGNKNHWLQVKLRGTKSNRQGIGAEVRVVAGGAAQVRQIGSQAPYLSQNSLIETFGLGAQTRADTIQVRWPSGLRQTRTGVAGNQRVVIVEGDSGAASGGAASLSERDRVQQFWALFRQATAERVAGNTREAAQTYGRALALDPDHGDALYYYGNMAFALGSFGDALRAWRHLVTIDSHSGRTHSRLGTLFYCLDAGAPRDLDSAEAHLKLADAAYREQTGTRVQLGEVALARGRREEAKRYFSDVLRTNAQSKRALFYVGYLAWQAGDSAVARSMFSKSVAAKPAAATAGENEGDTKTGEAIGQQHERCDELRSIAEAPGGTLREMSVRYTALAQLLARYRARSH